MFLNKTVILITIGLLSLGTIRQKEDPILRTQTEPISYKQKTEEQKDGVKGAPSPSFNYYSRNGFLSDPPVSKEKAAPVPELVDSEINPQNQEEKEGDWWDASDSDDETGDVASPEETDPQPKDDRTS